MAGLDINNITRQQAAGVAGGARTVSRVDANGQTTNFQDVYRPTTEEIASSTVATTNIIKDIRSGINYVINGAMGFLGFHMPVRAKEKVIAALDQKQSDLRTKAADAENKAAEIKGQLAEAYQVTNTPGMTKEEMKAQLKAKYNLTDEQIDNLLFVNSDGELEVNEEYATEMMGEANRNKKAAEQYEADAKDLEIIEDALKMTRATRKKRSAVLNKRIPRMTADARRLSPEEAKKLQPVIEAVGRLLMKIADNDPEMMAQVADYNRGIAGIIASIMLPQENATESDYSQANSYVDGVILMPIKTRTSELTQLILDHIRENNEMNRAADERVYRKTTEERQYLKIAEAKKTLRIKLERATELVVAYRSLEKASQNGNIDDIRAAVANINYLRSLRAQT